jgi:hypothetical protein
MAIPAAIYSLFMYLTGFAAIAYGKKLAIRHDRSERIKPSGDLSL